jgi:hypothetical protein
VTASDASTNFTGYYDRHGIPIHVGDLIRVEHYRHYRNRRMMWLYFRVAVIGGRTVVQNWKCLDPVRWQCNLADCCIGTAEVLASTGLEFDSNGGITTFNERPRKRRK